METGVKQLPQQFYSLKIKKGGKNEIYRGLARNGDEHGKNRKKPYCRSVLRGSQDLQVLVSRGGRRRFLWTQQVDAAAGVGEDEKTRGGDGGGARAARDSERRKMTEKGA